MATPTNRFLIGEDGDARILLAAGSVVMAIGDEEALDHFMNLYEHMLWCHEKVRAISAAGPVVVEVTDEIINRLKESLELLHDVMADHSEDLDEDLYERVSIFLHHQDQGKDESE